MKKTLYLLDINNYEPTIKAITMPYIERWAKRIGAEIYTITERKWPEYPIVYEKLQIYELAKERGDDWIIYVDSDCLIHPDFWDVTQILPRDTVLQWGNDFSPNRANFDPYILRDGRFIGTCNWFTVFSSWCLDFYKPLDDMTLEEAMQRMELVNIEAKSGFMARGHLIDDFVLTRNLARFGLKHTTLPKLLESVGAGAHEYLFHKYAMSTEEKVGLLEKTKVMWIID